MAWFLLIYDAMRPRTSWLAVAGLVLAIAGLARLLGWRRLLAALGLFDLTVLPIQAMLGLVHGYERHGARFVSVSEQAFPFYLAALIVTFGFCVGGIVGLLRHRSATIWALPARGIWSRKLAAGLVLFGLLFVIEGDVWRWIAASRNAEKFEFGLLNLVIAAYLAPLWDVLVRGWRPERPPGTRSIARESTRLPL